ncbi:MAG: acetolactate synthase large subunit, partial [Deltaproteobacteria bacterium]|nr:acetolactate synthase large subunit [Deltaproteobacteria bacterium]
GDGGFQMTFQELITIKKEKLAVKIIVLDNGYLGMVRQWQDLFFEKRYAETTLDANPDFAALANVLGIKSKRVTKPEEVKSSVQELLDSKEAMLLHVLIEKEANVFPMVPSGKSLNDTRVK